MLLPQQLIHSISLLASKHLVLLSYLPTPDDDADDDDDDADDVFAGNHPNNFIMSTAICRSVRFFTMQKILQFSEVPTSHASSSTIASLQH